MHYWKYLTCYVSLLTRSATLDKSIGACTDNHAASTYVRNSKDIASKALLQDIFYAKWYKIDVGK